MVNFQLLGESLTLCQRLKLNPVLLRGKDQSRLSLAKSIRNLWHIWTVPEPELPMCGCVSPPTFSGVLELLGPFEPLT